jgi:hypothetical protein
MPESASDIIERLFKRAGADPESAPLADAFASAYRDGEWTADALDARVRSLVEERTPSAEEEGG